MRASVYVQAWGYVQGRVHFKHADGRFREPHSKIWSKPEEINILLIYEFSLKQNLYLFRRFFLE